jgi:hypothetical protein
MTLGCMATGTRCDYHAAIRAVAEEVSCPNDT